MARVVSRRFCWFAAAAMAGIAFGAVPPAAAPSGQLIDHVWAGHPVGFALLTERGHQFVAYYDSERKLTVLGRKLPDGKWARIQPEGVPRPARKRASNELGWDSHNSLRLALDRDGRLHLSGNMHVDPLVYYRTREPFDVATLERLDRMTGEREQRCTYPLFFRNAGGELLFRYRDGQSGNGADIYNIYDTASRTWRRLLDTPLLEGEGERNAYAHEPALGPDGRFHLVWVWRETPDCATNHTLSYARSRDLVHWENSRGEPLPLPITLRTGEVIDPAKPGGGLINMTFNLGFDAAKRPLVVYHRYDAQHRSQAYLARPRSDAGGARDWEVHALSNWDFTWAFSGGGSIAAEVRIASPRLERDGNLLIDFTTKAVGAGRWRVRPDTLEVIASLPPRPTTLPRELRKPAAAGMELHTLASAFNGRRYYLRWETLPPNRDRPRASAPPPSELRFYEFAEADVGAVREL